MAEHAKRFRRRGNVIPLRVVVSLSREQVPSSKAGISRDSLEYEGHAPVELRDAEWGARGVELASILSASPG